ncbi:MAG: MFS transporter [Actinomycetota bacterium]|nr:MFS transporter [Actinomycetota bacterium]
MEPLLDTTGADRPGPSAIGMGGALFVAGVLALALNLRPAVTAVPSILDDIGRQYGYSPVVLTMVATVPVVCFGIFSPVAARSGRRFGDERSLGGAIAAVALGLALRSLEPRWGFFPGTIAAAGGIAFMNVLLSSLVKRRAPQRAGQLLGAYLAMLYIGSMVSSGISVPLFDAAGHDVALPLMAWAGPAAVALVLWVPQLRRRTLPGADTGDVVAAMALTRCPLAWQVTAFMGLQSLTYYATLSFLPDLFRGRGLDATDAGLVNTALSVGGLLTAVAAPIVVQRYGRGRSLLVGSAVVSVVGTLGALVVPLPGALALMAVLGLGQGVSISLALYFIMARAANPEIAGALSGMAQGVGYVIAALGPLVIGLLHSATGSWVGPFMVLAVLTGVALVFGLFAARDRTIAASARLAGP